jgi:hypothetical protein
MMCAREMERELGRIFDEECAVCIWVDPQLYRYGTVSLSLLTIDQSVFCFDLLFLPDSLRIEDSKIG